MYLERISLKNFKCFGEAQISLRYPGDGYPGLDNINVILGNNGAGKSAILKAIALGIAGNALHSSGFAPIWLARRPNGKRGHIYCEVRIPRNDILPFWHKYEEATSLKLDDDAIEQMHLGVHFEARESSDIDTLYPDEIANDGTEAAFFSGKAGVFFLMAFGATRRIESSDYSEVGASRLRGLVYRRVISLFEDHVSMRPLEFSIEYHPERFSEIGQILKTLLPDIMSFNIQPGSDIWNFSQFGNEVPTTLLSDGCKAFVGWVSDLLGSGLNHSQNLYIIARATASRNVRASLS